MVAATYYKGELIVSTTGSLDSLFVGLGKSYIEKCPNLLKKLKENENLTALFECCDPSDPHIVDEASGLYLLSIRDKDGYLYNQHEYLKSYHVDNNLYLPEYEGELLFGTIKEKAQKAKHEGYVIYSLSGDRCVKIK